MDRLVAHISNSGATAMSVSNLINYSYCCLACVFRIISPLDVSILKLRPLRKVTSKSLAYKYGVVTIGSLYLPKPPISLSDIVPK